MGAAPARPLGTVAYVCISCRDGPAAATLQPPLSLQFESVTGVRDGRSPPRQQDRDGDATGAAPISRLEFRQLVEVGVVVRDLEPVDPRTRKDEEIRQGNGHARRPATIGELNRPLPDLGRDLVVGEQAS